LLHTVILHGVGPEVLGDGDGKLLTVGEDFGILEVVVKELVFIILLVNLVIIDLTLQDLGIALIVELGSLLGLLSGDVTATVAEEGEEAGASGALNALVILILLLLGVHGLSLGNLELLDESLVLGELGALAALLLLGLSQVTSSIEQALGEIHVLLPVDANGLGNQTLPGADLAAGSLDALLAPVELLHELGVGEEGVLLLAGVEFKGEAQAAGLTITLLIHLEALDVQVLQGGAKRSSIGGQDVLVNLGGGAGEDANPEVVLDLRRGGDNLIALLEEGVEERNRLADWF